QALFEIADRLRLGEHVLLGEGELKSGGFRRPSILADALEAIFGAVFLDGGFAAAESVIRQLFKSAVAATDPAAVAKDPKTRLQEYLQGRRRALPQYSVVGVAGEAHEQVFRVECLVPELDILSFGEGSSRRAAEQSAAKAAYELALTRGSMTAHRTGHIDITGRPNVGKSTLLNRLVGMKISIVSRRPQTTRHRILGIVSRPDAQLIFVDTPGFQTQHGGALNRLMNRAVLRSLETVDAIVPVVEGVRLTPQDRHVIELLPVTVPVLLAINKIDRLRDRKLLLPFIDEARRLFPFREIVPLSAQTGVGVAELVEALKPLLPAGPPLYEPDAVTDRSERFLAAE